ncbi:hypothetical protein HN51_064324 [Arachis hypogaea]|uniref:Uncharacterized protein n=1 Tax=Arachis hypogaea TaxID=3818 RepID=A0A445AUY6_ARAHY|nr:hypothetical protein Ahy_B01g055037 [Arachis hypogaea]
MTRTGPLKNGKGLIERALERYYEKYIETSSPVPLYDVCFGGMILSYFVELPFELRHLEHEKHAKEHGRSDWFMIVDELEMVDSEGRKILSYFLYGNI